MASNSNSDSGGHDTGQMWAAISHEIRTPLMGVVGMLEVLSRTSLTDEQRRIIATAGESSIALMRIVDDVLDFAKLETSKLKLDPVPTDLTTLIESSTELLANAATAKGLALTCEAAADLPRVLCDTVRLRQVLLNLGSNAIKFTDRGHVAISVRTLSVSLSQATIRFTVADSGVGIPQDLHAFLFQPFTQLTNAAKTGFGGVGLGLAICRTLVEAMGGKISVESDGHRGTRFHVDIPLPVIEPSEIEMPAVDAVAVIAVDAGEPAMQVALRYLLAAGARIKRIRSLNGIAAERASSVTADEHVVVLAGPDAEGEDLEAAAAALRRVGGGANTSILWLHPRSSSAYGAARHGIRTIRAHPLRRAELLAAVAKSPPISNNEPPAPILTRSASAIPLVLDDDEAVMAARADGRVVLVAEDNPVNQQVLRQQLAILGYDCDIAANGSAALRMLQRDFHLALLCDCHMPGMDGFELTRIIRSSEQSGVARLPIIAITANAMPGEAARCKSAGMDDYLAKPIEIRMLQTVLERWIDPRGRVVGDAKESITTINAISNIEAAAGEMAGTVDLRNLAAVYGNDRKRLEPILDQWALVIGGASATLHAAIAEGKWADAIDAVHRIKGSAGIAGAHGLSAAGADLEGALKRGDVDQIVEEWRRVKIMIERAVGEIAAWRVNAAPTTFQAALSDIAASGITT